MDRQHDGRKPKADMAQLDAALAQLADSLMPTPGDYRPVQGGRACELPGAWEWVGVF